MKEELIITDRIYISGPMTGLKRTDYIERFNLAEQILRQEGYTNIVSPLRVWTSRFPWLFRIVGYRLTLLYDLWLLMRCQRIYKLPGWRESRGAQIESCVAFNFSVWNIGKPIREKLDKKIETLIKKQTRHEDVGTVRT